MEGNTKPILEQQVNSEETMEQFIRNSEKEFELDEAPIHEMTKQGLQNYIDFLDELWLK